MDEQRDTLNFPSKPLDMYGERKKKEITKNKKNKKKKQKKKKKRKETSK